MPMNSPTWQQNQPMQKPYQKPMMRESGLSNLGSNGVMPSNYKTIPCKYFEQGSCKYGEKCNFAHGTEDLRQGSSPMRPQGSNGGGFSGGMNSFQSKKGGMGGGMNPLISQGMMMSNQVSYPQMTNQIPQQTSPTQTRSTFSENSIQNQVAQMQINYLIQQLETYHEDDAKNLTIIEKAKGILEGGNVQGAATLLNEVIQRADKSSEDTTNYNQFINNIKGLGTKMFNEIQTQQQQQQQQQYSPPIMMSMSNSMSYNPSPMQQSVGTSYNMPMMQPGMIPQGGFQTNGYRYGPQQFPDSQNWQ